jgi:hypothetical protein
MGDGVERWSHHANPYSTLSTHVAIDLPRAPPSRFKALFFSSFALYIGGAGLPGYGNKSPPQ